MVNALPKQSSFSRLISVRPQKNEEKRRRFRHCKSAPLAAKALPTQTNGGHNSNPIFNTLRPSVTKVLILLGVYLGLGTVCFYLIRDQMKGNKTNGIVDALYFCIVTMTTVGYGDLVPNSVTAKLLACAYVFTGMALVGMVLSKAADYLVEKQEMLLVRAMHIHEQVDERETMKEVKGKKIKHKLLVAFALILLLVVSGTIFLAKVEKMKLVDALYCVCTTITTLGYGDKSFSTKAGRIFAVIWILTGTVCFAQLFLYVAELSTERKQRELVERVLNNKMTNGDLEAADLDDDGNVGSAEFVLYKLKEMGKISQEDVLLWLKEFEDLDADQTGTLSKSDMVIAQSSKPEK